MNQEDQVLDPRQQATLQAMQAPAGLWERIEREALERSARNQASKPAERPVLGGMERFANPLRFAAAGLMGFVSFFALQWLLVPDAAAGGRTSFSAGGVPHAERIREDIPLMGDSDIYVDSMHEKAPWPEIMLATSFAPTESN